MQQEFGGHPRRPVDQSVQDEFRVPRRTQRGGHGGFEAPGQNLDDVRFVGVRRKSLSKFFFRTLKRMTFAERRPSTGLWTVRNGRGSHWTTKGYSA